MQMEPSPPDPPRVHIVDKKVTTFEVMATPSRWLPRSFSARADPPSPFSSNPAHGPVSTPTTPAASFGCMAPPATDSPPDTPKDAAKPKPAPAVMSAAAFVAFLSPRRLMQRAARAFRSSRSRRRMKFDEQPAGLPPIITSSSRLSDSDGAASAAGSLDMEHGSSDGNNNSNNTDAVDRVQDNQGEHNEPVSVPEKIIHEMTNHQPPPPAVTEAEADEKENHAAGDEQEDEPKKAGAVPAPEEAVVVDVADKFCMVVKEAMMKKLDEDDKADGTDTKKKEAMSMFQGSRVKTAMQARAESEHPRRREVARSNDMIEEACTKLLAKRQGSRVRALVGAFETVMDAKPAVVPVGRPRHNYCNSV